MLVHLAAEPARRASIPEISRALAFNRQMVEQWTGSLCARGLLVEDGPDGRLRFATEDRQVRTTVAKVIHAYRTRRVAVVAQIISRAAAEE